MSKTPLKYLIGLFFIPYIFNIYQRNLYRNMWFCYHKITSIILMKNRKNEQKPLYNKENGLYWVASEAKPRRLRRVNIVRFPSVEIAIKWPHSVQKVRKFHLICSIRHFETELFIFCQNRISEGSYVVIRPTVHCIFLLIH